MGAKCLRLHCLNVFSTAFSTGSSTFTREAVITPRKRLTTVGVGFLPGTRSGPQNLRFIPAEIY